MKTKTLGIISANYNPAGFGELTENRPIATVPYGGRYRLIDFALSNMVNSGITTVGLITPYFYRSIMDHVGIGKPWNLAKKTGGLFILPGTVFGQRNSESKFILRDFIRNRMIFDKSKADYVLISACSNVSNIDYQPFIEAHVKSGCPITLMYKDEPGHKDFKYLKLKRNGHVAQFRKAGEDSDHMFIGCMIFNKQFLLDFMKWYDAIDNMDITDIIEDHLSEFDVNTWKYDGYLGVVSSVPDYVRVNMEMMEPEVNDALFASERLVYTKVQDEPPTIYKDGAKVSNSLVAAGCVIEGTVENSVIFRACRIEKGSSVKNSIVMQHSVISKDAKIENTILDKYVTIEEGVEIKGSKSKPHIIGKNRHF